MSRIGLTKGTAPGTPPAGVVYLYPKADGRFYFKNEAGVEEPMKSVGAGSGDLLADGTIPLTADWNVGLFKITANQLESVVASGTPPLVVASTDLVANLNADLLDGQEGSYYASVAYVDAAVVGLLEHKGGYNAATNTPDLDTAPSGIKTGDAYVVTAAGTFYAVELEVGDWLYANQDDPTASNEWTIVQYNIEGLDPNALLKSNLNASVDPTNTDDSAAGYGVGSKWVNTTADTIWFCLDDTASAAVWQDVGGGGGVVWSFSTVGTSPAAGTGTAYHDMAANVTATLPTSPALNDTIWLANNDNSDWNVQITAGGSNEIREMNVTGIPTLTLVPGDTCILVCQDAGATKKWGLFRMSAQGGGGGLAVEFKTASFTAEAGKKYMIAPAAAVVVTLPAGNDLDNIQLRPTAHNAGTYNITVNPDGAETIDNDTAFVIDQNEGYIDISYKNADTNWEVSASGSQAATLTKTRTVRTLIETIDNSGAAGKFDFANIPSGFDRLIIEGMIRSDEVATSAGARIFFNADTTAANYHSQRIAGTNDTTVDFESATPIFAIVSAASAPANAYSSFRIVVEQPDSGYLKNAVATFSTEVSATELYTGIMGVKSAITAAIDRLRVQTTDDPTSELLGVVRLYGEKDEEIGGGAGATKVRTIKTVIEKITNATAGEFDFNNIPSGYDRLIVKGRVRGDVTANTDGCNLYINADTTDTNYNCQVSGANNNVGQHWKANLPFVSSCPAASSPANAYSDLEVCMENPDGADLKCARASYGYHQDSANVHIHDNFLTSIVTAAITRLRFKSDNDPTDQLLGELTLYGEKDEEIGGGAGPVGRLVTDEIERITNATAGEFDFNNIPSGYDRLILKGQVRSDSAITTDGVLMFINSDLTAGNYHSQHHVAANGVTYEVKADSPRLAICAADNSPANLYTDVEATLENPDGSYLKACRSEFGMGYETDKSYIGQSHVISALTAAVTRLRVRTDNHATDQLFGTLILYGEKTI